MLVGAGDGGGDRQFDPAEKEPVQTGQTLMEALEDRLRFSPSCRVQPPGTGAGEPPTAPKPAV